MSSPTIHKDNIADAVLYMTRPRYELVSYRFIKTDDPELFKLEFFGLRPDDKLMLDVEIHLQFGI